MKNLIILFVFALSFNTAIAQRWNLAQKNSIDFVLGVDQGFWLLSADSKEVTIRDQVQRRKDLEREKPAFRIGFNYNYALGQRLFLKSGLRLINPGYRSRNLLSVSAAEREQFPDFPSSSTQEFNYNYLFLEVPLAMRYVYSRSWCKSYLEAGISGYYYLGTRIHDPETAGSTSSTNFHFQEQITSFSWMANLAIGAEFWVQNQIPVFIQLTGRYQLNNLVNEGIKERFVGLGIETGVRWLF